MKVVHPSNNLGPKPHRSADDAGDQEMLALLERVRAQADCRPKDVDRLLRQHSRRSKTRLTRVQLLAAYRGLVERGLMPFEREMQRRLQRKSVRTLSGVAPVTVLTKPGPCPGTCIFCPDREGMPKSYLPDEPGARRAEMFTFDPYDQTAGRILALEEIGHNTDKVELLILGGSWSAYEHDYQEWFLRRCFEAINATECSTLDDAQHLNETATRRNVGLVIETRPDMITPEEVRRLRRLGVTKVQLGAQSLDDAILAANRRGHTVQQTRDAVLLLRLAGFKIALHWMPNLLGATPESDLPDFKRLWSDPSLRPDELKIYPCMLLEDTVLHQLWQEGRYVPYDLDTLVDLLANCKTSIPRYCRVNRLMRDIPAPNIVDGVKRSNLRQIVQQHMHSLGQTCQCIRCREVRAAEVNTQDLRLDTIVYDTPVSQEYFLNYVTPENKLAGFLRLSLPTAEAKPPIAEIEGCAMIREVHVYGPALDLDSSSQGEAQHSGLGTSLLKEAYRISQEQGFERLAVIAAVGTRQYYQRRGFQRGEMYMIRS